MEETRPGGHTLDGEQMSGESIVYLAKEWGQESTSCDFVFEQLARRNRVMWVNSIATRTPNLKSAGDWRKIFRKLRLCFGGLRQVGPSAWLYQPVFIPLPFSEFARKLNRLLLRWSLRKQIRRLGMEQPQLWLFQPNGAFLIGQLDELLAVYYCVDEWSQFAHLDRQKIEAIERELVQKVDLCFAASEPLAESKRQHNPNTFLALHGVDYERFAQALDPRTQIPDDVAGLPRPVIGFFGGIRGHIDAELLLKIADSHPDWSVVLIGKAYVNVDSLRSRRNIHLLGHRLNEQLPAYCKAFSVGIIPYLQNEFIRHVNPIKLRQYLSAGLPVVSTPMPEVTRYSGLVAIAETHDKFLAAIEQALRDDNPEQRRQRNAAMRGETWEAKVAQVSSYVMQVKTAKMRRRQNSDEGTVLRKK